jgi:hypothetical protein
VRRAICWVGLVMCFSVSPVVAISIRLKIAAVFEENQFIAR